MDMLNSTVWYDTLCSSILTNIELSNIPNYIISLYGAQVFNQILPYHGNFAHFLPIFLFDIKHNHMKLPYLNLIFYLIEMDLVDIKAPNVYGKVPIDIIQTLYRHRRSECTLLNLIYTKRLAIVQQSFVRRWMARRVTERMRLKKMFYLSHVQILLAPPMSFLNSFPGGQTYHDLASKYI